MSIDDFLSLSPFANQISKQELDPNSYSISSNPRESASSFSRGMLAEVEKGTVVKYNGGIMLTGQNTNSIEAYLIANLSSSISPLVMTQLSLESILQEQVSEQLKLNFVLENLPTQTALSQSTMPPFNAMTIFSFIPFFV